MSAVLEAVSSLELHVGLLAGALAVGAVALVPPARRQPVTVVTGAMAVALALSMFDAPWAAAGVLCLAAAVPLRDQTPRISLFALGALGLALSTPSPTAGLFLAAAIVVAAPALGDVVSARGPALTAALLAVSVAGIWAAVPDTEEILLVGGTLALPLLFTIAGGLDRLDVTWSLPASFAIVGPVLWAAVHGGRGRPGSMVGGVACLGLLLVEPAARRITRTPASTRTPATLVVVLLAVQVAVVAAAARIAAARTAVGPAALVSTAALMAGTAVVSLALVALSRR